MALITGYPADTTLKINAVTGGAQGRILSLDAVEVGRSRCHPTGQVRILVTRIAGYFSFSALEIIPMADGTVGGILKLIAMEIKCSRIGPAFRMIPLSLLFRGFRATQIEEHQQPTGSQCEDQRGQSSFHGLVPPTAVVMATRPSAYRFSRPQVMADQTGFQIAAGFILVGAALILIRPTWAMRVGVPIEGLCLMAIRTELPSLMAGQALCLLTLSFKGVDLHEIQRMHITLQIDPFMAVLTVPLLMARTTALRIELSIGTVSSAPVVSVVARARDHARKRRLLGELSFQAIYLAGLVAITASLLLDDLVRSVALFAG